MTYRLLPLWRPALPFGLCLLASVATSHAQDASAPEQEQQAPADESAAPSLVAPELVERVEAIYPSDAAEPRVELTVALRILIDVEGRVSEAELLEEAPPHFAQAARSAVLAWRFRPALKNGVAIPARLTVRYRFVPPAPPAPVIPAADVEPPASVPPVPAAAPVEVVVQGKQSDAQALQTSAEAVAVLDMKQAKKRSADLGEVMARAPGVSVRRSGGLGSDSRFSLNGLQDHQIAFFVDGVPLDYVYPTSLANLPVNLVERVEVYRGVVPIRFGTDGLGGAVNTVTSHAYETRGVASYQVGSFGLSRATLLARYRHEPSGFVVGVEGFVDSARNDYEVDVEVPDERGRPRPARVKRFHDGYFAYGAALELGFVDRPWARRLIVRPFFNGYEKELQHNVVMTVPYGEVHYGQRLVGAVLRYDQDFLPNLRLELVAAYGQRTIDFVDESKWVYDWYGHKVRERLVPGEVDGQPTDQTLWQKQLYARVMVGWELAENHVLRVSFAPQLPTQTGDERLQLDPSARDPLTAKRKLFTLVSGVEYTLGAVRRAQGKTPQRKPLEECACVLENVLFAKSYVYRVESEEPRPGNLFRQVDKSEHRFGVGDGIRVWLTSWAFARGSYELATRLPRPFEVFGDGVLVQPNLTIAPELSHNANLGLRAERAKLPVGALMLDVNGFLRDTDRQIVLLGDDRHLFYDNVYRARTLGVEAAGEWTSPGDFGALEGNVTYTDNRNVSSQGTFGAYEGDRIPNRPWLTASFAARLRFTGLVLVRDELEPFYQGRYVHEFYRSWESQGLRSSKQVVPRQLSHGLGLSYSLRTAFADVSTTFEVQNLTNAALYDYFGVQRPGRGYYLKLVGSI